MTLLRLSDVVLHLALSYLDSDSKWSGAGWSGGRFRRPELHLTEALKRYH